MVFEGVEKRLVVEVAAGGSGLKPLDLTADDWTPILTAAQCEILSQRELQKQKIFLLSESTLAVWESGFVLKTCGKTSPLKALSKMLTLYPSLTHEITWLAYSRSDFAQPESQLWPHQSFEQEVCFLRETYAATRSVSLAAGGRSFHVAFFSGGACGPTRVFEEVLLFGVREDCVAALAGAQPSPPGVPSPLRRAFGDGVLDEFWFEPQGYSCNALQPAQFFDCHISPEPETSYASLEKGTLGERDAVDLEQFASLFGPQTTHRTRVTVAPAPIEGGGGMACYVRHEAVDMGEHACATLALAGVQHHPL
eukprot:Gregarina_sp_Pseudo_9__248@NODE_115_length_4185_cov_38_836469_g107_i0_p2_GENE_NODE_115_length_4185_cov_38_836469_g107_i0NODE_115_length_4185_cov_38_836469_g107_i0_p2_ORF_typecomplete_len309_score91_48SAM_decarbox/PF01536_16/6_4e48_NODE_115_length_4185_cov_38_836469_g107_i031424068